MSAAESQLFFARALLLILLYSFVGAVAILLWRELRAARRLPAEARGRGPGARLIVLDGGQSDRPAGTAFSLPEVAAIGRDLDNQLVFVDPTVSGRHAVTNLRDGAWWIEDLGSTNGTFVNGRTVEPGRPALLRSGDLLQVGGIRLRLVAPEASS